MEHSGPNSLFIFIGELRNPLLTRPLRSQVIEAMVMNFVFSFVNFMFPVLNFGFVIGSFVFPVMDLIFRVVNIVFSVAKAVFLVADVVSFVAKAVFCTRADGVQSVQV